MQQSYGIREARLLVIDDDRTTQAALSSQLGSAGYAVHLAGDGQEGLDATRELRPDVVLCDWLMPRVDGLEYCRRVKADPQLRRTYIAMLSCRTETDDKVRGLDAGADDFLAKPVTHEELLARVRVGLRVQQLQQELGQAEHRAALLEMAATLGHEINNPLTGLFGHLELVLHHLEGGNRPRMLHHIRRAGELAGRIANVAQGLTSLENPRTKVYVDPQRMLDLDSGNGSGDPTRS